MVRFSPFSMLEMKLHLRVRSMISPRSLLVQFWIYISVFIKILNYAQQSLKRRAKSQNLISLMTNILGSVQVRTILIKFREQKHFMETQTRILTGLKSVSRLAWSPSPNNSICLFRKSPDSESKYIFFQFHSLLLADISYNNDDL